MSVIYGSKQPPIRSAPPPNTDAVDRSTAIEGTDTVREEIGGPDAASLNRWIDVQIPYRNLADDENISERALGYVTECFKHFEMKIDPIRQKWLFIEALLRGNSQIRTLYNGQPVHVPELYKARETLIPRLREAVLGYDPFFEVRGREQMDKRQEMLIRECLRAQLYRGHFEELVEPALRIMLTNGFCAIKTWWHTETDLRVERTVKRTHDERGTKRVITRREKEVIVYQGPKFRLVDPLSFFIDVFATNAQDAEFVGDSCYMTYDEIEAMGKRGVYVNYENLLEEASKVDPRTQENMRSRGTDHMGDARLTPRDGGPRKFIVREFWGRFDPYGTGRTREFVITIANDRHVLRVQENPFDDKHRPYAIARCQSEAFTFFNVGPLDHAVHTQMQVDELRTLMFEAQKLATCPIGVADDSQDIPESLLGIAPGTIIRGAKIDWMKVPTSLAEGRYMEDILRRDIEEITGAPKIFEATEGGNTATEVERKIQEGNKRVRGLVASFTTMVETLLRQMHGLNAQYMTQSHKFRILGTGGVVLDAYEEVGPETFDHEVDFEFVGVANLQSLGLRATQLQQFLTVSAPFLEAYPNVVNVPALLNQLYKNLCGEQLSDEIVKTPPTLDTMIPQEHENVLLAQGQRVSTHEMDDDRDHIKKMQPLMESMHKFPQEVQVNIMRHAQGHIAQAQRKRAQKQAANNITPKVASAPNQSAIGDSERGTTGARGPQSGMANTPAQTPSGETPGPERSAAVPSADRGAGMFQTQNMQ